MRGRPLLNQRGARPERPEAPFSLSVRPSKGAAFRAGQEFAYWLVLKNVSNRAVAVKADLAVAFSYSQGEVGGGAGSMHWPCHGETRLIPPGQSLRQLGHMSYDALKPGRAAVTVLAARASGGAASSTPCGGRLTPRRRLARRLDRDGRRRRRRDSVTAAAGRRCAGGGGSGAVVAVRPRPERPR